MKLIVSMEIQNDVGGQIVGVLVHEVSPNDANMVVSFQRAVARLRELQDDAQDKVDRQVMIATESMGG